MAGTGKRKVVVAGYGSWAMTASNPAALTLERLRQQTWPDCELVAVEVPVQTNALFPLVEEMLTTHRPDLWLGLGVYPQTMTIRMEAIGVNCRDFVVADNDGVKLEGVPILEDGPAAYFSTLPSRSIVAEMRKAGIPAELSYSAGTHMCNQMLYTSLHLIEREGLSTRCGFLHVPCTPEFVAERQEVDGVQPSLPLSIMAEAATLAVSHSLTALAPEAEAVPA